MANDERKKRPRLSEEELRKRIAALVERRSKLTGEEVELFRDCYPAIFKTHYDTVWKRLGNRGLEPWEAENLLQETYLTSFLRIVEKGFPPNLPASLMLIASRKLMNFKRKRRRSPMSVGLPSSGSEPVKTPPTPERVMDRKELARQLLWSLPEELRDVVRLVMYEGMSGPAAALELGIPEGTVKSRLAKAKPLVLAFAKAFLPPSQREPE